MWPFDRVAPLSPFRRAKLDALFDCFDGDRNHRLDRGDFSAMAHRVGHALELAEDAPARQALVHAYTELFDELVAQLDEDGDGVISRDEFHGFFRSACHTLRKGGTPGSVLRHARRTFEALDRDGDRGIEPDEYALYLHAIGSHADPADAFAHLDLDGDGRIDVAEIEVLYTQWVCSDDPAEPGNWLMTGSPR